MKRISYQNIILLASSFLGLELISFLGNFSPIFLKVAFLLATILVLSVSVYKLKYGLLLVLLELIIGSKGYLLYWPISDNSLLSFRIVIWSLLMLVFVIKFLYQLYKDKKDSLYLKNILNFSLLKPYLYLGIALVLGLISAFIYQNEITNIFFDFNNWLYFLLLFPLIAERPTRKELSNVLIFGAIWLSLKTLILLILFSNNILLTPFYEWLRKTLVGEMTILDGGWNRIFIQSQSFVAIAYLFLLAKSHELRLKFKKKNWYSFLYIVLGGLFFSTIILSLSRSFWLGLVVAVLVLLGFMVKRIGIRKIWKPISFLLLTMIIGAGFIILAISSDSKGSLDEQISSRISSRGEAAVASRWSLLKPLLTEIKENPVTGQGFGATVTYISQDPRVLENEPTGVYTTYAFEWGYLDIWLKIGIIGVIAYLYLLFVILKRSYLLGLQENDLFYWGLAASIVFLGVVHFFTPYLNHPLGIGFIVASSCLIYKSKVY